MKRDPILFHRFYGPDGTFWGRVHFESALAEKLTEHRSLTIPFMKSLPPAYPMQFGMDQLAVPDVQRLVFRFSFGNDGKPGIVFAYGTLEDLELMDDIVFVPSVSFLRAMAR